VTDGELRQHGWPCGRVEELEAENARLREALSRARNRLAAALSASDQAGAAIADLRRDVDDLRGPTP
jgi:hypothetical protein